MASVKSKNRSHIAFATWWVERAEVSTELLSIPNIACNVAFHLVLVVILILMLFYLAHLAHVEVAPTIQLLRHSATVSDFPRARTTLFVDFQE